MRAPKKSILDRSTKGSGLLFRNIGSDDKTAFAEVSKQGFGQSAFKPVVKKTESEVQNLSPKAHSVSSGTCSVNRISAELVYQFLSMANGQETSPKEKASLIQAMVNHSSDNCRKEIIDLDLDNSEIAETYQKSSEKQDSKTPNEISYQNIFSGPQTISISEDSQSQCDQNMFAMDKDDDFLLHYEPPQEPEGEELQLQKLSHLWGAVPEYSSIDELDQDRSPGQDTPN
jgi:hypothetical protein